MSSFKKKSKRVQEKISVLDLIDCAQKLLGKIGIDNPKLDAKLLLRAVMSWDELEFQLNKTTFLSAQEAIKFFKLLRRRLCYEPIAYILGKKEFYGLEFLVNKYCLIPRPDTETVLEACLNVLPINRKAIVFELCTGSGAIAITLTKNCPLIKTVASDISPKALAVCKKNAQKHLIADRMDFLLGDLFEPFKKINEKADLIVANPPYISSKEMLELSKDIFLHEPHLALEDKGSFGLCLLSRIINECGPHLAKGGFLILEMGYNQSDFIREIACNVFERVDFFKDLAGHVRGVVLSGLKEVGK